MKTILKNIIILFLLLLVSSCSKEETEDYIAFSDFKMLANVNPNNWEGLDHVPGEGNTQGYLEVQQGKFLYFMDLSQGVDNHTWTVPETCSIDNTNNISSKNDLIKVTFNEPGIQIISLRNVMKYGFYLRRSQVGYNASLYVNGKEVELLGTDSKDEDPYIEAGSEVLLVVRIKVNASSSDTL